MSTVYVGNLDPNASSKLFRNASGSHIIPQLLIIFLHVSCHRDYNQPAHDLRRAFDRYGKIIDIWVAQKPPGFAFVDFDNDQDAKGKRITVALQTLQPTGSYGCCSKKTKKNSHSKSCIGLSY